MQKKKEIYVIGGGGTAKDIISVFEDDIIWKIKGIVLPDESHTGLFLSKPVFSDEEFLSILRKTEQVFNVIIAISTPLIRRKVVEKFKKFKNISFPNIFFDKNNSYFHAEIGYGNIVYFSVKATSLVTIGSFNIINTNVWLPHDVEVSNYCTIEMNVSIGGNVKIKEGATIGAGASLLPNIEIGKNATVGIGSVVFNNVQQDCTVIGNPAIEVFRRK